MVFVPAHIHALGEVRPGVEGVGNRPLDELALPMKRPVLRARREDHLVIVVYMHRDIGEAQHRLDHRRAIQDPDPRLHIRPARPQRVAHCPPHPVPHLQLAHPHRLAAVLVLLDAVLHRQERRRAMVVRYVPLDPSADPRADQADQRRLDHVLPVNEVVAVGLVDSFKQPPADLRQYADLDVLVLDVHDLVGLIDLGVRQHVVQRVGINNPLRPLRRASEIEHRIGLRRAGQIGRDDNVLLPRPHRHGIGRREHRRRCHEQRAQSQR